MPAEADGQSPIVGFVGAGAMGSVMVERLVAARFQTLLFARRPESAAELFERGATRAASVFEVGASSDVVILSLFTDQQVSDLCVGKRGLIRAMRPGSVLIVHTTGSPTTAQELAALAAIGGSEVLDAPVSGSPDDIRLGQLTLLVGGDPAVLASCQPVLSSYADPIVHVGPIGYGQRVKLVNNALFAAHLSLVVEVTRLGHGLSIDPKTMIRALSHCSGASRAIAMAGMAPSVDSLLDNVRPFLHKDLDVVDRVAAEMGLDLGAIGELGHTPFS